MIFHLHVCRQPMDPRQSTFASLEAFQRETDNPAGANNQIDIKNEVFRRWPGAMVMPVKVQIGSGSPVMLGILPSVRTPCAEDGVIPFVAFVRVERNDFDRKMDRRENPFDRELWRTPTESPTGNYTVCNVELRTTDLETPRILPLEMFLNHAGELVLAGDIGEGRVSFTFESVAALLWHAKDARERETDATFPGEPTREDLMRRGMALAQALVKGDEEEFHRQFMAYLTDTLTREPDALRKISMWVHGMWKGKVEAEAVIAKDSGAVH